MSKEHSTALPSPQSIRCVLGFGGIENLYVASQPFLLVTATPGAKVIFRRTVDEQPSTSTGYPNASSFSDGVRTLPWVESGEIVRFTYRVLDPEKAKALNEKKAEPYLIDEEAHVKLVVPSMEKSGTYGRAAPLKPGNRIGWPSPTWGGWL